MPKVSTACTAFQQALRHCWQSGSTIAEICTLGISKDQFIRLRGVLHLPLRMDRSQRAKPPRHRDPTRREIAAACAELRAKHLAARQAESQTRVYRKEEPDAVRFLVEPSRGGDDDVLERLIDGMRD